MFLCQNQNQSEIFLGFLIYINLKNKNFKIFYLLLTLFKNIKIEIRNCQ